MRGYDRVMRPRLAVALAVASILAVPASALADGASAVEQAIAGSGYGIDVTVTYNSGGAGNYSTSYGIGTVRVTLPGVSTARPPAFADPPTDPPGYTCATVAGSDGVEGSGFECSTQGTPNGNQSLLFPTTVGVHLLLPTCYQFPPGDSKGAARADLWSASFDPGFSPDATYALSSDLTCPATTDVPTGTPTASCVVPKLKGITVASARTKLKAAGCKLGRVTRSYSKRVKKGRVISQGAAAGKKLAGGAAVRLTVSRGPKPAKR
jgi:hypothetical protein